MGNIGVRKTNAPSKDAAASPRRRKTGKAADDDRQTQEAEVKFCDYSRSYTLKIAKKAHAQLTSKLNLTPEVACLVGSLNDVCTLLRAIVKFAIHESDSKLKRDMFSVLVGQLIEKTNLTHEMKDAAKLARGEIKTSLLAVHAMLDGQDWKRLLLAKDMDAHWEDKHETLGELHGACYAIPRTIYGGTSPVLRDVSWPSYKFPV